MCTALWLPYNQTYEWHSCVLQACNFYHLVVFCLCFFHSCHYFPSRSMFLYLTVKIPLWIISIWLHIKMWSNQSIFVFVHGLVRFSYSSCCLLSTLFLSLHLLWSFNYSGKILFFSWDNVHGNDKWYTRYLSSYLHFHLWWYDTGIGEKTTTNLRPVLRRVRYAVVRRVWVWDAVVEQGLQAWELCCNQGEEQGLEGKLGNSRISHTSSPTILQQATS